MSTDHVRRRAAVRAALRSRGLSALLVTDLVNIRYLTGFTGSNAALLLPASDGTPDSAVAHCDEHGGRSDPDRPADPTVMATDGRYAEQAAQQVPDLRVVLDRDCAFGAVAHSRTGGCGSPSAQAAPAGHPGPEGGPGAVEQEAPEGDVVGFEAAEMTVAAHSALQRRLGELDDAPALTATTGVVEEVREVKDEAEIELIARACAIGDAALADLIERGDLVPGTTERAAARSLEWLMYSHGADGIAFETIVAAGANSAIPHHRPTDAVLEAGDFVKLDFGATVSGYNSDMTRTVVLGAPSEFQRDVYAVVREAQEAGLAAVRAGAAAADVDGAARSVIEQAGLGKQFPHGLGHGVGLRVHEAPGVSSAATGMIPAGAVITVEPGVYHVGRGGVRIEDTLVVRDDGGEVLTKTGKDLRVL